MGTKLMATAWKYSWKLFLGSFNKIIIAEFHHNCNLLGWWNLLVAIENIRLVYFWISLGEDKKYEKSWIWENQSSVSFSPHLNAFYKIAEKKLFYIPRLCWQEKRNQKNKKEWWKIK